MSEIPLVNSDCCLVGCGILKVNTSVSVEYAASIFMFEVIAVRVT